jgi:hypothetical protein
MKRFVPLVLILSVLGCQPGEKISGPTGPVESVSFAFCSFGPSWMAIQNEGDVWKQVTVPSSGPITFDATEKVSIAMTLSFFGNFTLILNVTRAELDNSLLAPFGCEEEDFGNRELAGTASNIADGDLAAIHAGLELTYASTDGEPWSLQFLPNTPIDLVAVRLPAPTNLEPDRLIVRRVLQPQLPPATPQPVTTLDFAAADAVAPAIHSLTISGTEANGAGVTGTFITANGTEATLTNTFAPADGPLDYYAVPAALRNSTDLHHLEVFSAGDVSDRVVLQWFDAPGARTVTLGPVVTAPTITTVGTSPVRMRALVPAQSEYPTAASVTFSQFEQSEDDFDIRFVQVTTTAAFLAGLPTAWDLTIPDLSGAGYQADWGLKIGPEVEWQVDVLNATGVSIFGPAVVNGAMIATASRYSPSFFVTSAQGNPKRTGWQPFGSSLLRRHR